MSFFSKFVVVLLLITGASTATQAQEPYKPDDKALYDTILRMDSIFFNAYNTCTIHLKEYGDFYAANLEFYHDKGGVMNSRDAVIEATRKNICGKVTRELVRESVEVYPIAGFGAIEIGFHKFHNKEEPNAPSRPGRFVITWQQVNGQWKITRVISLH